MREKHLPNHDFQGSSPNPKEPGSSTVYDPGGVQDGPARILITAGGLKDRLKALHSTPQTFFGRSYCSFDQYRTYVRRPTATK